MPTPRNQRLAARFTLLFGTLAIMIVALAWMAWRATTEASSHGAARVRSDDMVIAINELDLATHPLASRAVCAITGGPALSAEELAPPTWPAIIARLDALLVGQPEMLDALGSFRREATLYEQGFVSPLRNACAQQQRLGAAEVQSRVRVAMPQRERVQAGIKRLRNLALERRLRDARLAEEATQASRRWLGLLTLASVLGALSAPVVLRSFSLRVSDLSRKLADEAQEREMAHEQFTLAQRRMRVVLDHVNDAVVTFDALGRLQWVNPAAELMFGAERRLLHGCPVTQILPGVDERMRLMSSPELSDSTFVDEHGLPWTSRRLYLEGRRAHTLAGEGDALALEVSLIQTRVDGQDIGVCVARLVGAPDDAQLSDVADTSDAALFGHAPIQPLSDDKRVDLRQCAAAAVEACATPAHVRDAQVKVMVEEEPLWIGANRDAVQEVVTTLLLKALDASPQGHVIGLTVMRVGQAARVVVSDTGAGIADLAALELTGRDAEAGDHAYGGSLAQARDVAKQMGGAVGFRPATDGVGEALWAQWPLIDPTPPAAIV